jgi:hypothetical protein
MLGLEDYSITSSALASLGMRLGVGPVERCDAVMSANDLVLPYAMVLSGLGLVLLAAFF